MAFTQKRDEASPLLVPGSGTSDLLHLRPIAYNFPSSMIYIYIYISYKCTSILLGAFVVQFVMPKLASPQKGTIAMCSYRSHKWHVPLVSASIQHVRPLMPISTTQVSGDDFCSRCDHQVVTVSVNSGCFPWETGNQEHLLQLPGEARRLLEFPGRPALHHKTHGSSRHPRYGVRCQLRIYAS